MPRPEAHGAPDARRCATALGAAFAILAVVGCGAEAPAADERVARAEPAGVAGSGAGFVTILRGTAHDGFDGPRDVAVDPSGQIVVVGGTESHDFPTTPGAYQPVFSTGGTMRGSFPEMDVFVTKLDPEGRIVWSTFLGGPNYDRAYAVELDAAGNVYVAGRAGAGFPTTPGALQTEFAGDRDPNGAYGPQDGFVTKFSPEGRLLWSTYVGNDSMMFIRDIAVEPASGHVVAVLPGLGEFPYASPDAFQTRAAGRFDNAIVKIDASGSRVHWGTLLGREGAEGEPTVRIDARGRLFVLTCTDSDGWVEPGEGFQSERAGAQDWLLFRLSPEGAIEATTYLGGSADDVTETHHLALDAQGRPVIAVPTRSRDLPIPDGTTPWRAEHGPAPYDGYAALLSADLDTLLAATYLGGGGRNGGFEGVEVDADGFVFTGGATGGGLSPTPDALQSGFGGDLDAFGLKLAPRLDRAVYLGYWGGPGHDNQRAMAIGPRGNLVSVGQTTGDVFVLEHPTAPGDPAAQSPSR